jgi:hypothetical protein
MTPVICLIFTYLIKTIATDQLPKGSVYDDRTYPYVFNDFSLVDTTSLKVNSTTLQPIPGQPTRNIPLQWYMYECVDSCSQNPTYLGTYDGSTSQTTPNGSTILGSIANDKSTRNFVKNITLNYYNDSVLEDKFVPFFVPAKQRLNNELFTRI